MQGESGEPQPAEPTGDAEARADFWSIQGDFIYRRHNEPRVQLYVPKEETFPAPLKYIDVTRSTHTDLDVLQEKRIDDNWKVEANRSLSDSWKGSTKFTLLQEKPPKGDMWSGGRLTMIQTRSCMARSLDKKLVKPLRIEKNRNGQTRNRSSTVPEERGIYFIDPDDREDLEILQNARRNWKDLGLPRCRVKYIQASSKRAQSRKIGNEKEFFFKCMIVLWNLTNL